jgi:hypothetical protein
MQKSVIGDANWRQRIAFAPDLIAFQIDARAI